MKDYIFIAVSFFALAALTFSCSKDVEGPADQNSTETSENIAKAAPWTITAHAHHKIIWHRPIATRPRDGAECGCVYCFGVCMVTTVTVDAEYGMPDPGDIGDGKGDSTMTIFDFDSVADKVTIYLLEDIPHDESTIVIDEKNKFRSPGSSGSGAWAIELIPGTYTFDQTHRDVTDGVDTLQAYGRVTIPVTEL